MTQDPGAGPPVVKLPRARQNPAVSDYRPVTVDEASGSTLTSGIGWQWRQTIFSRYSLVSF
jgi:hypothetical protein